MDTVIDRQGWPQLEAHPSLPASSVLNNTRYLASKICSGTSEFGSATRPANARAVQMATGVPYLPCFTAPD